MVYCVCYVWLCSVLSIESVFVYFFALFVICCLPAERWLLYGMLLVCQKNGFRLMPTYIPRKKVFIMSHWVTFLLNHLLATVTWCIMAYLTWSDWAFPSESLSPFQPSDWVHLPFQLLRISSRWGEVKSLRILYHSSNPVLLCLLIVNSMPVYSQCLASFSVHRSPLLLLK